ncbi:metalloregulator ArsR/SmtB family transcription factor [Aerococcaceae bacterium NML180378]|nr:metalloregulator ArsR/SmtB family transcription factor [Aerococcaceae bacterium NML180378]
MQKKVDLTARYAKIDTQHIEKEVKIVQKINVNSKETKQCVDVLKILAHPIRFSIASILNKAEILNVGAIQEALSLPQSTVSQHISKMRESGIVEAKREGTKIFYSLKNPIAKKVIKNL